MRSSYRALVKNPGFTAVAVTMLAVGIGANVTVFTVTNAMLFEGFPLVADNERIPVDPTTHVLASGTPVLAAALGCWVPARRASRVDPVVALRHD